ICVACNTIGNQRYQNTAIVKPIEIKKIEEEIGGRITFQKEKKSRKTQNSKSFLKGDLTESYRGSVKTMNSTHYAILP
ncbi:MAG: hypothetical protein WCG94_08385, partial [Methanothrix sp.]